MLRTILLFGTICGGIVALVMFTMVGLMPPEQMVGSQFAGYAIMLAALSLIFIGVKRYRDRERGGVIKFFQALLVGLGISAVAGVIYVIGWEITLAVTNYAFVDSYSQGMLEAARAKGASPADMEALTAEMESFRQLYANPLIRIGYTFIEILPVGILVSLISAALLRNSRFLPARARAAA